MCVPLRRFPAVLLLAVALLLTAGRPARAWNETGHMTVAFIAYQRMQPATRARVDALLKVHPDYPSWVAGLPDDARLRAVTAFLKASVWSDMIKGDPRFIDRAPEAEPMAEVPGFPDPLRHRDWHYIDVFFSTDGTPLPPGEDGGARTVVKAMLAELAASTASDARRSYDLPWLIHVIGDLHQPLHTSARVDAAHPTGDAGGNGFRLADSTTRNLHSLWDGALGRGHDRAMIVELGLGIMAEFPASATPDLNVDDWIDEGVALARTSVYTLGSGDPQPTVPREYRDNANLIARNRVALAGYRLAASLDRALAPTAAATPSRPTPTRITPRPVPTRP